MSDLELAVHINRILEQEGRAILLSVLESTAGLEGSRIVIRLSDFSILGPEASLLADWLNRHPGIREQVLERAVALIQKDPVQVDEVFIESGSLHLVMELLRSPPHLIICGAGHIGQSLASLAKVLQYEVTVIDDRAEFARADLFPGGVRLIARPFREALSSLNVTPSTLCVIVTRGHKHDEECLRALLPMSLHYIGMIGSRKRVITVFRRLLDDGYSVETIQRVHAPIGLDIGARAPGEIAVSIMAEIILSTYGGSGAPKRGDINPLVHLKVD